MTHSHATAAAHEMSNTDRLRSVINDAYGTLLGRDVRNEGPAWYGKIEKDGNVLQEGLVKFHCGYVESHPFTQEMIENWSGDFWFSLYPTNERSEKIESEEIKLPVSFTPTQKDVREPAAR